MGSPLSALDLSPGTPRQLTHPKDFNFATAARSRREVASFPHPG